MNLKAKMSPIIVAASALAFLLPFITISCGGQKVASFSGVQLAAGTTVEQPQMFGPPQRQKIDPEPTAAIAALCAIVGFLLSLPGVRAAIASSISGAVGVISLLVMKSRVDEAIVKQGHGLLQVNYETGYAATLLLLIGATAWNGYLFSQRSKAGLLPPAVPMPLSSVPPGLPPRDQVQAAGGRAALQTEGKCPYCGTQPSADSRYCQRCGRPLLSDARATRE